jgi:DNA-binding CsgD family transcriptional regulator
VLVARDKEVRAALGFLMSGVLVMGAPGTGKSALLREVASLHGGAVFAGGALALLASAGSLLTLERAVRRPLGTDVGVAAETVAATVGNGILLVDDVDRASPATIAVLEALAGRVALLAAVRRGPVGDALRDRLGRRGFGVVELEDLGPEASVELVRLHRPSASEREARRLAAVAGGNPLLLDALAREPSGSPALRLTLAAWLGELAPGGREAMRRLAVLRRPADPAMVDGHGAELLDAGWAAERDGGLVLRHPLLGEHALRGLSTPERQALHERVAIRVDDPAEAAHHHDAAGRRRAARDAALDAAAAATTVVGRIEYLGMAARNSVSADEDLRLLAARELAEALDVLRAAEVAAPLAARGGRAAAAAELVLAEVRRHLGQTRAAANHVQRGLDVAGENGMLRARLGLEWARQRADAGARDAAASVRRAWRELVLAGEPDAAAHVALADALVTANARGALRQARSARLAADRASRLGLACAARLVESRALQSAGRSAQAHALLRQAEALVDDLGEGPAVAHLRAHRAQLELRHRADPARALALHEALLDMPSAHATLPERLRLDRAIALADLGRIAEARAVLTAEAGRSTSTVQWARAEVDLAAGQARRAAVGARRALHDGATGELALALRTTLAWAHVDLGAPWDHELPPGLPAGVRAMIEACALLVRPGEAARAEQRFRVARGALSGEDARQELRCAWAEGEAARRAGALGRARALLREAEVIAASHDWVALVVRVRRSMRQAGLDRPRRGRTTGGILSSREREVLALVAEGLSSAEIATRLGVARSTIDSQVRSAMRKLGARTRVEAAVLYRTATTA